MIFPIPNPENPKERNSVWFEWMEEKDEALSAERGHPVFDTILIAHIMAPGSQQRSEATRVVERRKADGTVKTDVRDLGPQIDAFKKNDAGAVSGTPLDELAVLDRGLKATLRAMGVHDIEGLAAMSETAAPTFMGFRKYKAAAQAFLDQRAGQQPIAKLTEEVESWRQKYETLEKNHRDLLARVEEIEADRPEKRGPGRPRNPERQAA
jgi:hypothetical protein